jgi:RimJ/RimL family protein N-acetyltransferase
MLADDPARPLGARAAIHNVASQRALERHGFVAVDREVSYANGLEREVEEIIFRLA